MKLILKEYLTTLKEKDELDTLLLDLLLLNGYNTHNVPKSGERQYGVDIFADKGEESYLFVIKQKDITRKTWDADPNSVRQSIVEILDFFVPVLLPPKWTTQPINIIVATNGQLTDAVRPNWEGFCRENREKNGRSFNFDFWGIDELVNMAYNNAFNEVLFPKTMHSDLRKTLYFLDEIDTNNYYENIINTYMYALNQNIQKSFSNQTKHFMSFYMCINLVIDWARNLERNKIAIRVSEYALIKYWQFLHQNNLFENEFYVSHLIRLLKLYELCNKDFCRFMLSVTEEECELPYINPLEQRILLYEVIGLLSSYGYYLSFSNLASSRDIVDCLISLLNSNQAFKYPIYDKNICEISLLFMLLYKHNRQEDMKIIIHALINGLMLNHIQNKKTPAPNDTYEEALAIEFGKYKKPYLASVLYAGLIEWCCVLNLEKDYYRLQDYLSHSFDGLTIQTWHINNDEEIDFYSIDAVYKIGASPPLDISKSFDDQIKIIGSIASRNKVDEFSFYKYSFASIALITCRYYNYPLLPEFWRKKELLEL